MRYEELTIEGRNAVLEAFRAGKTIDKVFLLDGCQDGPIRTILREAKKADTIVNFVKKERLDQMSETGKHQGVIASAAAYAYAEVEDMIAAYTEGEEWLEQLKDYLDGNFAYIDEYLKKNLPKAHLVKAEGTYLAWLDLNGYVDRDEKKLEELMQKKAKVALDEGYIFGEEGRGFERINVASPRSVIEECMNRIRTAFEEEKLV